MWRAGIAMVVLKLLDPGAGIAGEPQPLRSPQREWGETCRAAAERDGGDYCWSKMHGLLDEMYPGLRIQWDACRDRSAAEMWGWALILESPGMTDYIAGLKRACGGHPSAPGNR